MLAEFVHLHLGDEEASRERFVYEQQEAVDAATQREHQRTELEEIAGSLRAELTLRNVESHFAGRSGEHKISPPARIYC